jgi:excisionase family DNA binding protein
MQYISTAQAAKELNIGIVRVNQLIKAGRLKADRIGHAWLIVPADLEAVRDRKRGRPKKKAEETN